MSWGQLVVAMLQLQHRLFLKWQTTICCYYVFPKARCHIRKNGNRSSRLVFLSGGMLSLKLGVQVHSVLNWLNNWLFCSAGDETLTSAEHCGIISITCCNYSSVAVLLLLSAHDLNLDLSGFSATWSSSVVLDMFCYLGIIVVASEYMWNSCNPCCR